MTDNEKTSATEMTDNEIIKALECCTNKDKKYCTNCPLKSEFVCVNKLASEAVDLIKRQKAEIEDLKSTVTNDFDKFASEYDSKMKSEAVKEFAERLKEEIKQALKSNYKAIRGRIAYYENQGDMFVGDEFVDYCNGKIDCLRGLDDFCDNLVKEMVGDAE